MRAWWFYRPVAVAAAGLIALNLGGCGYNNLQRQDENVKAAWSEVVNQYQRRADLVPNLVNTVKGFAQQEQQVLIGVTEARAKVGSIQVSADVLNNPEAFARYQAAQNQLTQSLKSLLVVSERYPDLKSNENFRDLQAQLEGTENRITVARNRYIDAVREYNINVRSFPTNLTAKLFDFQVKPNFTVADEQTIATAPTVDFGNAKPSASQPAGAPTGEPASPAQPGAQPALPRAPVEPGPPTK
jgi:LemA protein